MILLLLLPVFVMVTQHELARGIYVRLTPRHHPGPDEICLLGPIVVTVRQHGSVTQLFLGGTEVSHERFEEALKSELARRANWEVFVEGDDSVSFADPMYAVDAINTLHAKAVILTPRLKEQLAKACSSRYNSYHRLLGDSMRIGGARRYPWRYSAGSDFVVLEDPDGNLFCVVQR
jgi:biopolymer transport protein ExbD